VIKRSYFDRFRGPGWPTLDQLAPFFLAPPGQEWSYKGGNDSWGFDVQGLEGTEHLPRAERVNVHLYLAGNPQHGVYMQHRRWDGRLQSGVNHYPRGDLSRLREFVYSMHGTPLSVGLFIPFRSAWSAVKEFIETDGELPKSIEWVASRDLPPEAFPDP
jgi:hypothetical protein